MDSLSRPGADTVAAYEGAAARPKIVVALSVLALALALLVGILLRNGGHFSYTLDAPYTQMAMAEQIARGTYGLNAGEPSSPSSSIIYPFLLALLSFLPLGQFSALLVCLAATLAAAVLMYAVAEEIGLEVDRLTTLQLVAITATLTLAFNFVGLAFAGLEHSLHVTLTVISLLGLLRFVRTRQADWWWLAAITLLPLLRFEAAAALAADMLVLIAFGKWRHAAIIGAVGVVLVGGFMLFLHSLGLPWLPSSVLHRSEVASTGIGMGDSGAIGFVKAVYGAYRGNLMAYGGTHIALLIVLGLWGLARGPVPSRLGERVWAKPAAVGFFIVVALAQLTGGSLSSFSRYEIYVLALGFCAVLVAWQPEINAGLRRLDARRCAGFCLAMLFLFSGYVFRTVDAVAAAGNVHDQQYQMHRFVNDHWRRPFAANHLGYVNYQVPYYMLDLSGLANEEARKGGSGPGWVERLAAKHDVGLAMLYDVAPPVPPAGWQPIAQLKLRGRLVTVRGPVVTFYATRPEEAEPIRAALRALAPELPRGAILDWTVTGRVQAAH